MAKYSFVYSLFILYALSLKRFKFNKVSKTVTVYDVGSISQA